MPSGGITAIKVDLAVPFNVEASAPYPTAATEIVLNSPFDVAMATGMHNGWTCASPTTPSTFQTAIVAAFSAYTLGTGQGLHWITCIGTELDAEVDLWVASWDVILMIHTYTPSAGAIISRIQTCELYSSNARTQLDATIANTFIKYFEQEVG